MELKKPVLVEEVVKLPGVRGTSGTLTRFHYLLTQRHSALVEIELGANAAVQKHLAPLLKCLFS